MQNHNKLQKNEPKRFEKQNACVEGMLKSSQNYKFFNQQFNNQSLNKSINQLITKYSIKSLEQAIQILKPLYSKQLNLLKQNSKLSKQQLVITQLINRQTSLMHKFKRPLTINIVDDTQESPPPKNQEMKQMNQYPTTNPICLTHQDEEEPEAETEQLDNAAFGKYQNSKNQKGNRKEKSFNSKLNIIEFQQFTVEQSPTAKKKSLNSSQVHTFENDIVTNFRRNKKQFSIEIPEVQQTYRPQKNSASQFVLDIEKQKNVGIKEPPAPSNKSKLQKFSNRHFVFPTNDQQQQPKTRIRKQSKNSALSQQQKISKAFINEINQQWSAKLEQLSNSFQKERQQFYKQKSNLQKDLMIKDGQIEMLQKLITNKYSPKESNSNSSFSNNNLPTDRQQKQHSGYFPAKNESEDRERMNSMEAILLEKDLQINQMLEKINQLNQKLQSKANDIQEYQINIAKLQKNNDSLKNQLYVYEKKDENQKLTKQFYKLKQFSSKEPSKTPKGYSRPKWEDHSSISRQKDKQVNKKQQRPDVALRGIDDLHKRLESLKMNRMELQCRGKIKSEIGYSQTSKHKGKGMFDFKGKYYDRDRDYVNHSRLY